MLDIEPKAQYPATASIYRVFNTSLKSYVRSDIRKAFLIFQAPYDKAKETDASQHLV